MTTDTTRAALAQALEALRLKYSDVIYDQSPELARRFESDLDTIIAAEAALAAPQEPVAWMHKTAEGKILCWTSAHPEALRLAKEVGFPLQPLYAAPATPAQAEPQEPVAAYPKERATALIRRLRNTLVAGIPPAPSVAEADTFLREFPAAPARAQCDGGKCGLGGYCDECPKTAPARQQLTPAQHHAEELLQALRNAKRHLPVTHGAWAVADEVITRIEAMPAVSPPRAEPKALTHAQAVALLDEWAGASCTRFTNRSYTTITTGPVERDSLLQLIHAANHALEQGGTVGR